MPRLCIHRQDMIDVSDVPPGIHHAWVIGNGKRPLPWNVTDSGATRWARNGPTVVQCVKGSFLLGKVNRPTMFFYLAVATSRGEGLVHQKLKYFHET